MNFDNHTKDYSEQVQRAIPVVAVKHEVFLSEKANQLVQLCLKQFGATSKLRVLDVGCGVGLMESALIGNFKSLVGVDVASESIEKAKETVRGAEFFKYDGVKLPFEEAKFDVVFACCVFHHIPAEQRSAVAQEMSRVCVNGGLIVIFEHNPLNPITRLIVSRCEFDQDAVLLQTLESKKLLREAGLDKISCKQILYFPWRHKILKAIERLLSWIPLGAQYIAYGYKPTPKQLL